MMILQRAWAALAMLLAAVYLFTAGFLLRRPVLPDVSQDSSSLARYDRLVFVVVDALRYDFAVMSGSTNGGNETTAEATRKPFYVDRLPILTETLQRHPEHTLLLQYEADAPTSTLQRLKGLTTGSLPTFVDVGSSFSSAVIDEDNLILQLHRRWPSGLVFLGDDTWISCFPTSFNEAHAFPSFNVWDLHTVDNGVLEHLVPLLKAHLHHNWRVIVAHFLGVDHCGHRYGSDHPAMANKLDQMNRELANVIEALPPRTLLIVAGDHGMTWSGDHGGDSAQETASALFMHASGPPLTGINLKRTDIDSEPFVRQIDLVPTVSWLLGIPIPTGSLGMVLPTIFGEDDWAGLLAALDANVQQMKSLLNKLSHVGLDTRSTSWTETWAALEAYQRQKVSVPTDIIAIKDVFVLASRAVHFLRAMLSQCRQLWSQFDTSRMTVGVIVCLVCMVYAAVYVQPKLSASRIGAGALVAIHTIMMGSNSFVVYEDRINAFMLGSTAIIAVLLRMRAPYARRRIGALIIFLTCIRWSTLTTLCREEQIGCEVTFVESDYSLFKASVAIIGMVGLQTVGYLRGLRVINRTTRFSQLWFCGFNPACGGLIILYWLVKDQVGWLPVSLLLARLVYILAVLGTVSQLIIGWRHQSTFDTLAVINSALLIIAALLLGPAAALPVLLMICGTAALGEIFKDIPHGHAIQQAIVLLMGTRFFYATGHQPVFSAIRWSPGFVGLEDMHVVWSGLLVTVSFFSGAMMSGSIALLLPMTSALSKNETPNLDDLTTQAIGLHAGFLLGNLVTVFHLRRHLMVWKIFAPRFIYQALSATIGGASAVVFAQVAQLVSFKQSNWPRRERQM